MREYKEKRNTILQKSVSDLSFYSAGYQECAPKYGYGPICRAYHLIHFVLSGKGILKINEHVFQIETGDAFIIPEGKVAYYEADEKEPWCYAWVSYLGIHSHLYTNQLLTASEDKYIIHHLDTEKYKSEILEILSLEINTTSTYFKANSILLNMMSLLYEDIDYDTNQLKTITVADDIKFYLDLHYSENLKMTDVAKSIGIHPNYMTRIFKETYGESPKKYLTNLKLKRAGRLLLITDLSIATISSSLGFENQLSFSRVFKNKYALSPSDYREQKRITLVKGDN